MTQMCVGLILLILSLLAPWPTSAEPTDKVTVAIYRYGAPFTLVDPVGNPAGLLVQMWRLWAEATGVEVSFLATSWADSVNAVRDGRADIHSGLFQTRERTAWMAFSDPIHEVETSLYVRTDDGPAPETPADLKDHAIGALAGSYQLAWLKERFPDLYSIGFPNSYSAFVALLAGDIDAVLDEAPAAGTAIARLGLPGSFSRAATPLFTEALRAGLRADRQDLLQLINDGFRAIPRSTLAKLESLWLPDPADHFYAGGSGTIRFTDAEKAWLADHPVIRLATTSNYPPYGFLDAEGFLTGFHADLIRLLNRKLGTQIVPEVFANWQGAVAAAMSWQVDGILGISLTPERLERLKFSAPYTFDPIVLITRSDGPRFDDWDALKGATISIDAAASWADTLRTLVGASGRVVPVESEEAGMALLRNRHTDGHVGWRNTFDTQRAAGTAEDFVIRLSRNIEAGSMRIGVPTDRQILLDILRKGLNAISIPERSRLHERWLTPETAVGRGTIELSPLERRWLSANPKVVVGNERDWPPFDFAQDGVPRGFSIDIIKLAARKVGLELDFVTGYSWAELMSMFRAGEIDILPAVYQTPERRTFMAFTRSYSTNPSVLVTQAGRTDIVLPEDLRGRSVAVVDGFATAQVMAERWPEIRQVPVENVLAGLKAVSLGDVDAFVGSIGVISYVLKETYIPNLQVVSEVSIKHPDETRLHIGVLDDALVLRDLLQKGLDAISADEMVELRQRWLPYSDALTRSDSVLGLKLSREQRQWLAEHRTLRIGDDFNSPPFSFLNDTGHFAGISAGYLEAVADRLNLKLTTETMTNRADAIGRLGRGELDVVTWIVTSDPADAPPGMLVTTPYVSFPVVIATRRDHPFVGHISDLNGRRIGLGIRHLDAARWQTLHPNSTFTRLDSADAGLEALVDGRIDAYIDDLGSITYAIESSGNQDVKIAAPTDETMFLAVGVRPDWPELVGILDAAFSTLSDAERRAIKNSWLAVNVNFGLDLGTVLLWAAPFAASGLAILVVILIWNRRLGAEILQRKRAQARLTEAHELIQSSISYAGHIQRSLLPGTGRATGTIPFKEHFVIWEPRDLVGGDMLWTRSWGMGTLLILADCTGHGVPGAFMTLITTGALDRARLEVPAGHLDQLVQRVHQLVQMTLRQHESSRHADDGLELGACFVETEGPEPKLTFCGARFSLFCVHDGTVEEIKGSRRALGYRTIPFEQTYPAQPVPVRPGATFYLTTDGLIDQIGGSKRRAFGRRRFSALLQHLQDMPLADQEDHLWAAFLAYQQSEPRRDDVSLIGFRVI